MIKGIRVAILTVFVLVGSLYAKPAASNVVLTDMQKASLLFMYQEEKVARDVYLTFAIKYPATYTFSNIAASEQKHMDSVENLCRKYNVDISNINEAVTGVFVLPELQNLYNTLTAQGSLSLVEGLKVGVVIEEKDIIDIVTYEQGMPADVVQVFENLRAGSYNHLTAFQTALLAVQ
ncbi:MAG: DUF2202 domain-containing protein [Sulfuricurvum sp.]|uniref:ferritin-like domain-containing protein n=1 Tax=Sulfuricurvum sp. TaxID=2025608 RepID=UPI00261E4E81|nr:DUF2202 domain-containing protein [Sulfuricurvum sp.]MDD2369739.1 DUF2202 domain-containing protein [Sulfuricurvum sp.]MDD2950571.1 DUF2202 domain-containing protein [Sulfuricurvum sp.]MDD5118803.1 DUF2202 domain-containing protein [Sulfuricurvum sp.]